MKVKVLILFLMAIVCNSLFASDYEYVSGEKVRFSWSQTDAIGIMQANDYQIKFYDPSISTSKNIATFGQGGWALYAGDIYYAYSPYDRNNTIEANFADRIPFSYEGQKQINNNNLSHLSKYDYLVGALIPNGISTNASFDMKHVGAILRFSCSVPETVEFDSFSLTSDYDVIPTSIKYSLVDMNYTPQYYSNSLTLNLENVKVVAGNNVVAYVMVPPVDLGGIRLRPQFKSVDGKVYEGKDFVGFEYKAGRLYNYYGELSASDTEAKFSSNAMGAKMNNNEMRQSAKAINAQTVTVAAEDFVLDKSAVVVATAIDNIERQQKNRKYFDLSGRECTLVSGASLVVGEGRKCIKR